MPLTPTSPYYVFDNVAAFPATGASDTFYLDRSTVIDNEQAVPADGDIYLWNGTEYEFYFNLDDETFLGVRPTTTPVGW